MPPARTLTGENRQQPPKGRLTFPQKVVEPHKRPIFQVQQHHSMVQYRLIIAPRSKARIKQREAGFPHQEKQPALFSSWPGNAEELSFLKDTVTSTHTPSPLPPGSLITLSITFGRGHLKEGTGICFWAVSDGKQVSGFILRPCWRHCPVAPGWTDPLEHTGRSQLRDLGTQAAQIPRFAP